MQTITQKAKNVRLDWMFDPYQDLLYFFLPVPLAILMFAAAVSSGSTHALLYSIISVELIGLGSFHQGATWFHFLDKNNRSHYLKGPRGKVNFILVPVLILLLMITGEIFIPALTFLIYMCWTLNHAVQQNIGVLLLYQNGKSENARVPREIQIWSQRLIGLSCALFFFRKFLAGDSPLSDWMWLPIGASFVAGIWYCGLFIKNLSAQISEGKSFNLPEFAFWILSVTYLLPFAFLGNKYEDALLIPLVVHWCQYIGINYVLTSRKYEGESAGDLPSKHPIRLYVISGLALVLFFEAMNAFYKCHSDGLLGQVLTGFILGTGMVHYYLDGIIWRFRDKFPREAILPYLIRQ